MIFLMRAIHQWLHNYNEYEGWMLMIDIMLGLILIFPLYIYLLIKVETSDLKIKKILKKIIDFLNK